MSDMPAYSGSTGKHYPDWDALVAAETHGFVVVAVPKELSKNVVPWVVGPWATKREANNCRQRMRNKLKQVMDLEHVSFYIRHAWKDV
jgi:hypothetical protein